MLSKRFLLLSLSILLIVLMSGCCTYSNQSFWEVTHTKIEFEANNFQVKKLGVQGTAGCYYLFGIGGQAGLPVTGIPLSSPSIVTKAMNNLHAQSDVLGKSAFFHNINVEWSTRGIPFLLLKQRITITADVYEFIKEYLDYKPRD